jgi:hypothetical protein
MLQHHDARTPATVGANNSRTPATAWVPATAWTRKRAQAPVTEKSTSEETPATAWVPTSAWTRAGAWTPVTACVHQHQQQGRHQQGDQQIKMLKIYLNFV